VKYPECEDCAFYEVEPAMCDECEDGDQFEPAEDFGDRASSARRVMVAVLRRAAEPEPEAA
jgi:hypothetical protein